MTAAILSPDADAPLQPAAAASTAAGGVAAPRDLLAELAAGLAAGDDLRRLLERFLEPLMHIAGATGGAVRVLGPREQHMHLAAGAGLPPQVLEAERAVESSCGACGAALAGAQPVWAHDLTPCVARNHGGYFGEEGCRRVLAVPLQHRGRVLGLINLFFKEGPEPANDVLALLKTAGELLGLALDNARLARENLHAHALQERQALAADVHDGIGQSLAFVKMRLLLLHDAMRDGRGADAERYFADVRDAVGQAHAGLRSILTEFRTPPDPQGLAHALAASAESFRRSCPTTLELEVDLPEGLLRPEMEVQVALVAREALANVARHAAARHATLRLGLVGDGNEVQLQVQDDGAGFAAGHLADAAGSGSGSHYGLTIMQERARRLGGTFTVQTPPEGGTCLRLRFALPAAVAAVRAGPQARAGQAPPAGRPPTTPSTRAAALAVPATQVP
ncbi:MAG: GAF domain-containing protein [Rubrivivax sp.]|nr:GAF domain-containing protein [Rubrivivax sp.]